MNEALSGAWRLYSRTIAFVVLIMYAVGLAGHLQVKTLPLVLSLTPVFLLVFGTMALLPSLAANGWRFAWWAIITYFFTLLVEAAGVATGSIFGEYVYGPTLGWSWHGVPLIIGFNWILTVNGSVCMASRVVPEGHGVARKAGLVLLAAALATAFDFVLEPVAVRLDYWRWRDGVIPLQNYVAWFLTAGLVAILHPRLERSRCELGTQGRLAGYFLAIQAAFFTLLRFGWWWQGV